MTKLKNKKTQRGAALAIAIIMVAIISVIALTALAFSSSEARIAGSDLQRTQTFYATSAAIEKMTNEFSNLFRTKMRPTSDDLDTIAANPPPSLIAEGFTFDQTLTEDTAKLQQMQATQGLASNVYPRVNIPEGPFAGLYSTIVPYKLTSIGNYAGNTAQVKLEREFNNYLIPLFQFGIFSNEDIEFSPGVQMIFNGRIHSNKNIYAIANTKFLNRLTMAGEFVRNAKTSGAVNTQYGNDNVFIQSGPYNVRITKGSVQAGGGTVGGPYLLGSTPGTRGYFPTSPQGIPNPNWESTSLWGANGSDNRFGGQILTNTTGVTPLKLPVEFDGNNAAELIKRSLPQDSDTLSSSRYHTKSQIRILIDDESAGSGTSNTAGIPAGKGVYLSSFQPSPMGGGNALRRIDDSGNYLDASTIQQQLPDDSTQNAMTVRGVKTIGETVGGNYIPSGAGLQGKILIEVVKPDGTTIDVTQQILSMGMTEGEPNGIVYMQRPLWAAYLQGSRDRDGNGIDLATLTRNNQEIADGEINDPTAFINSLGYISGGSSLYSESQISRHAVPSAWQDEIIPINVYNVREGFFQSSLNEDTIYERGMTSIVEVNMHNLARWVDGIYDANLLASTNAVSANIKGNEGYVVYISDRRGDKVKTEHNSDGSAFLSTNGIVDNEDIYGPNGTLDQGEDVINFGWNADGSTKKGSLQKDITELPDTGKTWCVSGICDYGFADRKSRANAVIRWQNPHNYFRRAVRLFDGESLSFSAAPDKLSPTKGITIASENMVYIWGNYNTKGITSIPAGGSTLNDGSYLGAQIPSSIVADAIFPLSKTWFDGLSAMYPEGTSDARNYTGTFYRRADANISNITQATSVRAGIICGDNMNSMSGTPGRDAAGLRKTGGINNFPRFLESWSLDSGTATPWNYTGSINPLYYSTQAISQWENVTSVIYTPPQRNWSFDSTYLNPNKLPPGTPYFQYIQTTGFRQNIRN